MAIFIPHRCPKCFESVTLIQPQYKEGAFKGSARGQCLNCMDEQEFDLTVSVNGNQRRGVMRIEKVVGERVNNNKEDRLGFSRNIP